ncbi:ABC-2 type transport system permease protein [Aliiruegeria haliotis]|uniref:Transport permease protein n=1 Tax=Aliiruegeria haliotis TaxID=1280846 RepID=A0A2T0RWR3_9RHOB|nr:ABC transporter permease [Aliiruegeria haliotis]PRY25493.1 ABC-2 type transport system permease protein [Aliiruegeria haliotis]
MTDQTTGFPDMGVRRFGRFNWLGLWTLIVREMRRFLTVWMQTVLAPLVTAGLFLAIFSIAIGPSRGDVMGVGFLQFIAPGILTMTVIQNAFANTSSSILVSKVQGNIVDTLMPPLSAGELVAGYIAGGVGRGLFVALPIGLLVLPMLGITVQSPLLALAFITLGAALMSALGMVAATFANKFDQMAAITNFIVTPMAFLSGTFYSVEAAPPAMQALLHWNPMFYLIDGVRFAVLGISDSSPLLGFAVLLVTTAAVTALCWSWMRSGYRLKA